MVFYRFLSSRACGDRHHSRERRKIQKERGKEGEYPDTDKLKVFLAKCSHARANQKHQCHNIRLHERRDGTFLNRTHIALLHYTIHTTHYAKHIACYPIEDNAHDTMHMTRDAWHTQHVTHGTIDMTQRT